jgi:hypothetical protein
VTERKIDTLLDAALLDYEPLEDFDDIRFEGEWALFRTFAKTKQRTILPKASAVFASVNGSVNPDGSSSPGLLGSLREKMENSPFRTPNRHQSLQDLRGTARADATSDRTPVGPLAKSLISPKSITDVMSGVLVVLQLYEVNPAIVIQAFSQVFFWISCELFNRILTRKKYLCRSKAVQIRMNVTALDDWVRSNGLPIKIATKHLEPVTQLLQWLHDAEHAGDQPAPNEESRAGVSVRGGRREDDRGVRAVSRAAAKGLGEEESADERQGDTGRGEKATR